MKKGVLSKILIFLGVSGLLAAGAWQASLQARSSQKMSPLIVSGSPVSVDPILDCREVRSRVGQFLDLHYLFRSFDEKLSQRTFERLFEAFDPTKSYFLASDIAERESLRSQIHLEIAKANCEFIFEIRSKFLERFNARTERILALLSEKMDFDKDEEMFAGESAWAKSTAELDETWRKRIKFQTINLMTTDSEEKARERLKKRYILQRDNQQTRNQDETLSLFLNAFASALDPHSSHFLPADQEDFNIRLGNRLEGIGATLREEEGYITVQSLMPGGAAEKDGRLKIGDKIIGVDPGGTGEGMTDLIDMELSRAVRLIRGNKGTTVKLLVLRNTENGPVRLTFDIVRASIELTSSRAKSDVLVVEGKRLGVVRLPSFYTDFNCRGKREEGCSGAANDVLKEIESLEKQNVEGVILDLRNNGGGDLHESILLSGLFVEEGSVVQTVDRRRVTKSLDDEDARVQYKGPLLVLINKYSASASEIVSGMLQDYGRALIVGDEHTFGKATVQIVQEIPGSKGRVSDGAIKVTQSKFYRPSGRSNQEVGVQSDLVIPSELEAVNAGERENKYALEPDRIRPAVKFAPLYDFSRLVPDLAQKSRERIAKSPDFSKLAEKIVKLKQQQERSVVSLRARSQELDESKKLAKSEETQDNNDRETKAFRPDDFALKEAGMILIDAIAARKNEKNWVSQTAVSDTK